MHEFQQFADQLDGGVCAIRRAEWGRDDEWNVGLHVLGRGVSIVTTSLYGATELMRGGRGRWGHDVQYSDPDAATATELKATRNHHV